MSAPRRIRVTISDLRREISELRHVGAQMSNLCFNWSQHDRFTPAERETLSTLQKQWDAIKRRGFSS